MKWQPWCFRNCSWGRSWNLIALGGCRYICVCLKMVYSPPSCGILWILVTYDLYNISYRTYCEFWKSPTSMNFALASSLYLQPGWPSPSWLCGCARVGWCQYVQPTVQFAEERALQGGDANKRLVNTAWVCVPRLSEPWKLDGEAFRLDEAGKIQLAKQSAKLHLELEPGRSQLSRHFAARLTFGDLGT